jgi:glycosyltransferase involved in cell wall biosynthesis
MNAENPLVSILMTAYNREKYIAAAIESVLASTYKNFELIIVDDGSKDDSVRIARTYETQDSRIRVYVNEQNLGDYPNRNKAASYARGQYLKYLDSDDAIYPHGLEVMVSAMTRFPEAGLGSPYHKEQDTQPYPYLVDSGTAYKEHFINEDFLLTGPSGVIIKRSLFEEVGGFSGKRFVGDTEMWMKLAARQPVVKFQMALFWWRQHETQEFRQGQGANGYDLLNYLTMRDILLDPHCPLKPDLRDQVLARSKKRQSRTILSMVIKQRDLNGARTLMNKSGLGWREVMKYSFSKVGI